MVIIKKSLPSEYLRVYSPSAEVREHVPGQEVLKTGKASVTITRIEPIGQYALKIVFSDGHDSGLYDWDYLYQLAHEYDTMWTEYLQKLKLAESSRFLSSPNDGITSQKGEHCPSGCKHQQNNSSGN